MANSNDNAKNAAVAKPAAAAAPPSTVTAPVRRRAEPEPIDSINMMVVLVDGAAGVSTPTTIYEYELPVLEAIHGEEMVHVHSEREVDLPEGLNAAQAHSQLLLKYPPKLHDVVKGVYPTPRALARNSGLSYKPGDNKAGRFNQAIARDHSVHRNSDASLTGADLNDPRANQGEGGNLEVSAEAKQLAEEQRAADAERRASADADKDDNKGDDA